MSLKEQIDQDIKQAMRDKDQAALRALRAVKSAILLAETSEGHVGTPLSAEEELKLVQKQARQRRDSIDQFTQNGRADLAATEAEELVVLERYLPKGLTEAELEAEVKAIIAEAGATTAADIGKVMKLASPRLAGRAEGKQINEVARSLLGS
jgi:uncharacterized protein